jgi:serpin B
MKSLLILPALLFMETLQAQHTNAQADSNNDFAFNLYQQLKDDKQPNLFFSPFSISSALAMTYAGAEGNTKTEMSKVLHFNPDVPTVNKNFSTLFKAIMADTLSGVQLNIANSIWVENSFVPNQTFVDAMINSYHSELRRRDFQGASEQVRIEINNWAESMTRGKIKDVLPDGSIDDNTIMVLVNAIYFYGKWAEKFDKKETREAAFYNPDKPGLKANFMNKTDDYGYYEDSMVQAVDLPYKGDKLSMMIVLPKDKNGMKEVESKLNSSYYTRISDGLSRQSVTLSIPKFKTTASYTMNDYLKKMGMRDAFIDGVANFKGMMTGNARNLWISGIIHKAFIDVQEEGTEAAAVTAVVIEGDSAVARMPKVFKADHPLIFMIRDNTTGSILFMGKINAPNS